MTQRFPHDFWSGRNLETKPDYRWDASRPRDMGRFAPYGYSRGADWETLAPADPEEVLLRHFIDETVLDELDDEPIDESPHACVVEDLHPAGTPTGLFIPEKYEPNYPYPVIVWFHDAGGDESEWLSLMPQISTRNYFGISLQGTMPVGNTLRGGWDWPNDAEVFSRLEKHLFQTLCELRRTFHIHSERVFLAGSGSGASAALRLFVNRPEWFAGAFALGGELSAFDPKCAGQPELRDRRAFLTMPSTEADAEAQMQNLRLWRAAGLNLMTEVDEDAGRPTSLRLNQLNHWVMESICAPV